MEDIEFRANDYGAILLFSCFVEKVTIPLIGVRPIFEIHSKMDGRHVGGGDCEIIDIKSGMIKYQFKSPELDTKGFYQGKVILELPSGAIKESLTIDMKVV